MFEQSFHITVSLPINYNIVWYHGKDYMKGEVVWGHTPPRVLLAILRLRSDLRDLYTNSNGTAAPIAVDAAILTVHITL